VTDHAAQATLPAQDALVGIFADVLGLDSVGPDDDFFAVGGDSVAALTAVARARGDGMELGLEQLYTARTPRRIVQGGVARRAASTADGTAYRDGPALPAQDRVLRLWQDHTPRTAVCFVLECVDPLEPAALEAALHAVVAHHDALRVRLHRTGSGRLARDWRQRVVPAENHPVFEVVQLSASAAGVAAAIQDLAEHLHASIDPVRGPMLRVAAVAVDGAAPRHILVVLHHFCADLHSTTVIRDDLETAYRQTMAGAAVALPRSTGSMLELAARCVEYATGPQGEAEARFWSAEAERLRADRAGPRRAPATRYEWLNLEVARAKVDASKPGASLGRSLFEAVAGALTYTLRDSTAGGVVSFSYLQHGRGPRFPGLDLSRTVGWPMTEVPVLVDSTAARTVRDAAAAVHHETSRPPGDGLGFLSMWGWRDGPEADALQAVYDAVAVVVNVAVGAVDAPGRAFRFADQHPVLNRQQRGFSASMTLACTDLGANGLRLSWGYDPTAVPADTIRRLAHAHRDALLTLTSGPGWR
jgi:hypothetical protein